MFQRPQPPIEQDPAIKPVLDERAVVTTEAERTLARFRKVHERLSERRVLIDTHHQPERRGTH